MADQRPLSCLSAVATLLGGRLIGEDASFSAVSTDSRSISSGALFVALRGPNFEGEQFLQQVHAAGAVGAIVQQQKPFDIPQIVVGDTLQALGQLAAGWRAQFEIPVVAITGSNGKTTVKEMVASILHLAGQGTVTQGNFNNEIGVPLTLLRLTPQDRWAVVEMGASAVGDIEYLCKLAQPTHALVNNIGAAHLGGFGSMERIAQAKGEIYTGLRGNGTAVINQNLPQASLWMKLAEGKRIARYATTRVANSELLSADTAKAPLLLSYQGDEVSVQLKLLGEHNRTNAVAAAALALEVGASLIQVKQGLESLQPVAGRLQQMAARLGSTVIDDSYNPNPDSMKSGVRLLSDFPGKRVLVLGDMGELGEAAASLHQEVGQLAQKVGIDKLFAFGEFGGDFVAGFGGGVAHVTLEALLEQLDLELGRDTTILVKGSRFMRMERVVNHLLDQGDTTASVQNQ